MLETRVDGKDWGPIQLVVIWSAGGQWVGHGALQQALGAFERHFTTVPEQVYQNAMAGHTMPLVKSLGVPSDVALKRLPLGMGSCLYKDSCVMRTKHCQAGDKKLPDCFYPTHEDALVRDDLHRLVWAMQGGAYVIVVLSTPETQT